MTKYFQASKVLNFLSYVQGIAFKVVPGENKIEKNNILKMYEEHVSQGLLNLISLQNKTLPVHRYDTCDVSNFTFNLTADHQKMAGASAN